MRYEAFIQILKPMLSSDRLEDLAKAKELLKESMSQFPLEDQDRLAQVSLDITLRAMEIAEAKAQNE